MADFIEFDEGSAYLLAHGDGLPTPCYFALSTRAVDSHTTGTTAAGGFGEIIGTGYLRQSQPAPTPVGPLVTFSQVTWNTGAATNWPNAVRSLVLVSGASGGAGAVICAWNLLAGGGARNLAAANTQESCIPSLLLTSGAGTITGGGGGGGGGGESTAYDAAVLQDTPVYYLTDSTTDKGSGGHSTAVVGGSTPVIVLPNGGNAWSFDSSGNQYLRVASTPDLSIPTSGAGLTVEFWWSMADVNQPNYQAEQFVDLAGKSDWVGANAYEYEMRYYRPDTTDAGNGPYGICSYAFNAVGGFGAGHDDRQVKPANTWYHWVGIYYDRAATVDGISYPNGYVQLWHGSPSKPTQSVSSYAPPPPSIIDSFTAHGNIPLIVPTSTGAPLYIGTMGRGFSVFSSFYGSIGKFAVYPRVLTPARILAHYNAMMSGSGGGGGAGVPTVSLVTPFNGPAAGGTAVRVQGTNLSGTSAVYFGGVSASPITNVSATEVDATSPPHAAGTVDVSVKTAGGVSVTGVPGDVYTYDAPPPPSGGDTAYDTRIKSLGPILYLDGSTPTSNKGSGAYTVNNHGSVATSATMPSGDSALVFDSSGTKYIWIPDPSDGSLSISKTGKLTIECWVQIDALSQPHSAPGMNGGTNILGKCADDNGYPPLVPPTDGNEYELRFFDAASTNTDPGNNWYGNFCYYAFSPRPAVQGSSFGAGWDDHMLDLPTGPPGTGKTTSMWIYMCGSYNMTDLRSVWGTGTNGYQYGAVEMFCGYYPGDATYYGRHRVAAPMFVSWAPTANQAIVPGHTTCPLTIGACGLGSTLTGGAPTPYSSASYFQGKIGKFAVYPFAFTEAQALANFAAMHP